MPVLRSAFCGCCSLSTATKVIGVTCTILYGIDLLSCFCGLIAVETIINEIINCSDLHPAHITNGTLSGGGWIYPSQLLHKDKTLDTPLETPKIEDDISNYTLTKEDCDFLRDSMKLIVYPSLIVATWFCFYMMIASGFIIYGAMKRRRGFLLPWIVGECVTIPFIISTIVILLIVVTKMTDIWISFVLTYCFTLILMLGIFVYLILIVISFYQEMAPTPNFLFVPLNKDNSDIA